MTQEKKELWSGMTKGQLMKELGRYYKKMKDQAEEVRFRNKQIKEMEAGMREMSVLVDSVISRVIDKYGCYGYGGEFIAIPAVIEDMSQYDVSAISVGGLHVMIKKKREES